MGNAAQQAYFRVEDESSPLPAGQRSANPSAYRIGSLIGKGNFGKVYDARVKKNSRRVAVKMVDVSQRCTLGRMYMAIQLKHELALIEQAQHPSVIRTYECFKHRQTLYFVMELAPNGNLLDYVNKKGRLSEQETRDKAYQTTDAVRYLHKAMGYAHLDIKCENVLLDEYDNVKLADFGLAMPASALSVFRVKRGTNHYMSPEQLNDTPYSPFLNDTWACGVVIYMMLCGELPFAKTNELASEAEVLLDIRRGVMIPSFVSADWKQLLSSVFSRSLAHRWCLEDLYQYLILH